MTEISNSATTVRQYARKKGEYSTLCWNVLKVMIRCHPKHPETLSLVDFVDAFIFLSAQSVYEQHVIKGLPMP